MSARTLRHLALGGAATAAVLIALAGAAGAHVEAEGTTVDGVTTVELSFHHGCDGAATTGLRMQLPEGATDVEPQDPAGWTSTVASGEVSWTGGSVADGAEGHFVVSMTLVDPEGTTVFLPTIQQCGADESAWIDKSDDPEAENAAPRIVAGAAVATTGAGEGVDTRDHDAEIGGSVPEKTTNEADPSTTSTTASDSEVAAPATESASSTSGSTTPIIIGIIAAVVVIGAVIAFVATRRSSSSSS